MAKPSFPPPALKQKKTLLSVFFVFVIRSQALRAGHPHPIFQFHIAQASALYFRYAQVPNARLGNVNASIDASLA
jgi:hypothetical protein